MFPSNVADPLAAAGRDDTAALRVRMRPPRTFYARCAHEPRNAQVVENQEWHLEVHGKNCRSVGDGLDRGRERAPLTARPISVPELPAPASGPRRRGPVAPGSGRSDPRPRPSAGRGDRRWRTFPPRRGPPVTQGLPATGLVGCGVEELPVHKTLDHEYGMFVLRLPVRRQAFEAQAHRPGGQIGKLLSFDQDDEPAVVGQQMQPPCALFLGPFDRLVAGLEVEGGGAPADPSQPGALGIGDDVRSCSPTSWACLR
jgi:hypothetical protein